MKNPNLKAFNSVTEFIDSTVHSYMQGWGCFTAVFIFFIPVIFMLAGIKWLFTNGYIS